MSFFQSSSWNFGPDQGLEDFTDLENNIDVGKNCWWNKGHSLTQKHYRRPSKDGHRGGITEKC